MQKYTKFFAKLLLFIHSVLIAFSTTGCFNFEEKKGSTINPSENVLHEGILYEHIDEEIYLKEIVVAEDKISEILIQNDKIDEVLLCQTIYIPQNHIQDFSENSQVSTLFKDVNLRPFLTKIAIGTGVILTLTVLNVSGIGKVSHVVASVAPAALREAVTGAITGIGAGSLFGGLLGGTDAIDETGRTSAVIGFATAVAGLTITTVSLISEMVSGGASTITAALGLKLFLAGVSLAGTVTAGYNAIKTFQKTEAADIDWNDVDWNKVGESAIKKSIEGAANGYMWGSIIGALRGGIEGYNNYIKQGAPNSNYEARIGHTPKEGQGGHWTGKRGESTYKLDNPTKCANGTIISEVEYKNGIPDFSRYEVTKVKIPCMTNNRATNFNAADKILAKQWSPIKFMGKEWSARDVCDYRIANGLTWHEMNNMIYMQLVPKEVNSTFGHLGGVGEYNAMIGQTGGV